MNTENLLSACMLLVAMAMPVPANAQQPAVAQTHLKVGDVAPDFTLPDESQKPVNLSDFRGKKNVILAFYVMAFGPNCSNEIKAYQADIANGKIDLNNTAVLGIGMDNPYVNAEFGKQLSAQFPLLSDMTRKVTKEYGILNYEKQIATRATFVIDKQGIIQYIEEGQGAVDPTGAVTMSTALTNKHSQVQNAQPTAAVKRTILLKQDLSIRGFEAVMVSVDLPPGSAEGRHTHPAEAYAFVQEGLIVLEVAGKPDATLKAGDIFYIASGQVHQASNKSNVPAKLAVVFVAEKGKPLTTKAE